MKAGLAILYCVCVLGGGVVWRRQRASWLFTCWATSGIPIVPRLSSLSHHCVTSVILQRESEQSKEITRERVEEDRKPQIEAAIVRVMKVGYGNGIAGFSARMGFESKPCCPDVWRGFVWRPRLTFGFTRQGDTLTTTLWWRKSRSSCHHGSYPTLRWVGIVARIGS